MNGWVRHEPATFTAADAGGDRQVSDAWDARFSKPLGDGQFAHVTRYFYVAADLDADGDQTCDRTMEEQTEYLVCRDPYRPGDTEQWSGARHSDVAGFPLTDQGAHDAAVRADWPSDEEWNAVAEHYLMPERQRVLADDDVDGWG